MDWEFQLHLDNIWRYFIKSGSDQRLESISYPDPVVQIDLFLNLLNLFVIATKDAFLEPDGAHDGVVLSCQIVEIVVLVDGVDAFGIRVDDPLVGLQREHLAPVGDRLYVVLVKVVRFE